MQHKLKFIFEMHHAALLPVVIYLVFANLFNPPPGLVDKSLLPSAFPKCCYISYEKDEEAWSKSTLG